MSKTDLILQQIAALTPEEAETVYQELKRRLDRVAQAQQFLANLASRGPRTDVWEMDAQEYINQQRADDRF